MEGRRRGHRFSAWLLALVVAATLTLPATSIAQGQRVGAWVDTVLAVEEPDNARAVSRLEANDIQVYFFPVNNPELAQRVERNRALDSQTSYGLYTELTFNPIGPVFPNTTRLNPFSVARIREAVNWLIDRNHIANEIMGGLGSAKFFPLATVFPDYAKLADVARRLELQYAPNPDRAKQVITEEMQKLGATLVGGKWQFRGAPVSLIFLIRTEDERRPIGDYVSGLLEQMGFTVERRYGTARDLSPLWIGGDPATGRWHLYTGGWITTVIARNEADNWSFFYTDRGLGVPLWQAYKPAADFDKVAERLEQSDFGSVAERQRLMAQAMDLGLKDSVRVWLVTRLSIWPKRANVAMVSDLAGGFAGSFLWPFTLRFEGRTGGTVRFAMPSMLTQPWNPVDGSNWIYDTTLYRATQDYAFLPDPFTGLVHPQRVERAEVTVKRGLPVSKTLPWVTLNTAPSISVPGDALISWDAKAQRFLTVREKHPQGLTANAKTVVRFERDLLTKAQWHDGNRLTMGDIMMGIIVGFDRAQEGSAIFDAAAVPAFKSFEQVFRGFRIVSQNPLVVEYYSDFWQLDAELIADGAAGFFWPNYGRGPGAWHTLALGVRAEAAGQAAFSSAKATKNKVEHLSYIAGPTVATLDRQLAAARSENYIPYAPTLGQFISADEAKQRWTFLTAWREGRGHFWVGMGPFLLQRVAPVEKIVELRRFSRFPDPSTKWLRFGEPKLAAVTASGPRQVKIGEEATFDVKITFKGQPYPANELESVKYLLFDAKGALASQGDVQRVGDAWRVVLSGQATRALAPGSNKLEIVVISKVVSIPTFASVSFTTLP